MAMTTAAQYCIDNTNFLFRTNFSGDPARDTGKYPNDQRKANIIIPSEDQAKDMLKAGIPIKKFQPKPRNEGDPMPDPIYYAKVQLQYRKKDGSLVQYPPKVYLIPDEDADQVELTEETVSILDTIRVKNVKIVVRPFLWDPVNEKISLKIKTMYVEQAMSDDPYADYYKKRREAARRQDFEEEEDPF